jgi:integrase
MAIGELLRRIDVYHGNPIIRCALRLAPHVFVRPGELRFAEWSEFYFETCEWRIPSHKMKSRSLHIVPLSNQVLEILAELKQMTGYGQFLFPGRAAKRPISENTLNAALRYMGYAKEQMTCHGFRSMASTRLNEHGWNRDAIERQLAHAERDEVRAAYNYADHLPIRKEMMQWWSNQLDQLKFT